MKLTFILTLVVVTFLGCTQTRVPPTGNATAAKPTLHVPLPKLTPYDSNPKEREAYLKRFAEGYAVGITGWAASDCNEQEPFSTAKVTGWYDGTRAGREDYRKTHDE